MRWAVSPAAHRSMFNDKGKYGEFALSGPALGIEDKVIMEYPKE